MTEHNFMHHTIPHSATPFRFSRAATGLVLAALCLIIILVYSTFMNINRSRHLMENFLYDKAETIFHSIEAGSRASFIMMHHMRSTPSLHTLLMENIKEEDILFISITNQDGVTLDQVGYPETIILSNADIEAMKSSGRATTKLLPDKSVFIYSQLFSLSAGMHQRFPPPANTSQQRVWDNQKYQVLSIGIHTREYDIARKQDVRHAVFMGTILLLVGLAGLYFLFLYQKMRLTSSRLADMKLYTDSIIESIPVSLITLDAENRVVSCNNNTTDLFNITSKNLQQKNISKVLPDCSEAIIHSCTTMIDCPVESTRENGKTLPLKISCSPLVNQNEAIIGKVLIIRDMSSIRNMELQLERSRRMAALGKMAAGVAHEIRNPLGTLRGFAQFFGNVYDADDEKKQYADLMISEIDRLNATVSSLLQFSRPREPLLQRIKLDELFDKTVTLMDTDFSKRKIQFTRPGTTNIEIEADPDLLLQVLMNLLKNSINATDANGRIRLSCHEDGHHVRISVSDNGRGMSEQDREKMFDPFFTTNKNGTGLGLAVSHQIVEQHHGRFEVTTGIDQGTTITMILPKEQ